MKPRLPIQITIPEPCHEDWNKMTLQEQGRFCDTCQKFVKDFTGFSDDELYQFIMNNRGNKICGRFKNSQLNRDILLHITPQPHSQLYKWMIAAGLALIFSVTPESKLFAQAPIEQNQAIPTDNDTEGDNTYEIKGIIKDESGEPIIAAVVEAHYGTVIIGGAATDYEGHFVIKPLEHKDVLLRIKYIGYKEHILQCKNVDINNITVELEPNDNMALDEVIILGAMISRGDFPTRIEPQPESEEPITIDKYSTGNNRTISGEDIQHMSR